MVSEMERDNAMYFLGGSGEASAVCRLLGSGKAVEMDKVLAKCNAKELPHHLQPDMEVLKIMIVDSAAVKEGRFAFVYFELPRPQFFLTWLPASVIGQKIDAVANYDHQPLAGDVSGLRKRGAALIKASYSKMFFWKLEHYFVAYEKWSMAAIGCDQWSVTAMTAHRDLVLQIIEDERRTEGWKGLFICLVYCELRRKSWSARACKMEKAFRTLPQLEEEASVKDLVVLSTAKSRIGSVLQAAGIWTNECTAHARLGQQLLGQGRPGYQLKVDESEAVLEGVLAKQGAAGAALTKNAQSAIRTLAGMQDEMFTRTEVLKSSGVTDRPNGSGRDRHSQEFCDRIHKGGKDRGDNQRQKRKFENNDRGDQQGGGFRRQDSYNKGNSYGGNNYGGNNSKSNNQYNRGGNNLRPNNQDRDGGRRDRQGDRRQ